jgi:hypothetical protein
MNLIAVHVLNALKYHWSIGSYEAEREKTRSFVSFSCVSSEAAH